MDPVVCGSCGTRLPVSSLTEDDYRALHDQHHYQGFAEELRMLLKVQEYYRRHPDAEGCIKPHFVRVLESDDPKVMERLCAGVPFDQIELPPEQLSATSADVGEDSWSTCGTTSSRWVPEWSSSPKKSPASRARWEQFRALDAKWGGCTSLRRNGTSSLPATASPGIGQIGIALIARARCT
jgi:hypothetical protein